MSTSDRIAIRNRANAQFSTGPTTKKGKAISARNALKHGATSKQLTLPVEDPVESEALVASFEQSLALPQALAGQVANELALLVRREDRIAKVEQALEKQALIEAQDLEQYEETARIKEASAILTGVQEIQRAIDSPDFPPTERRAERAEVLVSTLIGLVQLQPPWLPRLGNLSGRLQALSALAATASLNGGPEDTWFDGIVEITERMASILTEAIDQLTDNREKKITAAVEMAAIPDIPTLRRLDAYRRANESSLKRKLEIVLALKGLAVSDQ